MTNRKHFLGIFLKREALVLLGKGLKNFLYLLALLTITFTAIGFANGSLDYLQTKMNDPFITWLNLNVPYLRMDQVENIIYQMNDSEDLKDTYQYQKVQGYFEYYLSFKRAEDNQTLQRKGRTIDLDDPILATILDSTSNLKEGRGFQHDKEIGLIVTDKFLEGLEYDSAFPFVNVSVPLDTASNEDRFIPLPIIAIVSELPDLCDFVSTVYFHNQKSAFANTNPFNPTHTEGLVLLTTEDSTEIYDLERAIEQFFHQHPSYDTLDAGASISTYNKAFKSAFEIHVTFFHPFSLKKKDSIFQDLSNSPEVSGFSPIYRSYHYRTTQQEEYTRFDKVSIHLNSLDKIGPLNEYLSDKQGLKIDQAQTEPKENYNFVSKLAIVIPLLLIFLGIFSTCIFISDLLNFHLYKIRMNIGTFMAFGMKEGILKRIYIGLIFGFILISTALALLLSWILGALGVSRGILALLQTHLGEGADFFHLFDTWTIVAIGILFISSLVFLIISTGNILNKDPGDLIYDRV